MEKVFIVTCDVGSDTIFETYPDKNEAFAQISKVAANGATNIKLFRGVEVPFQFAVKSIKPAKQS